MASNSDKIQKLVNRLGSIDDKMSALQSERDEVAAELSTYLNLGTVQSRKTGTPVASSADTNVGDKIYKALQSVNGLSKDQLVRKFPDYTTSQIGLSLYHQTKAGRIVQRGDQYYVPQNLATAAAKASPADTGEEEL